MIVADDVALAATHSKTGRRGIAGTLFVHKIAGAASEEGKSLAEVAVEARDAADAVRTMGVALTPCTVPGATEASFTLKDDEIELGLGIHGEAGAENSPRTRGRDRRSFDRRHPLGREAATKPTRRLARQQPRRRDRSRTRHRRTNARSRGWNKNISSLSALMLGHS